MSFVHRFPHASGVDPGGFENNFKVNEFEAKFPEGKVTHYKAKEVLFCFLAESKTFLRGFLANLIAMIRIDDAFLTASGTSTYVLGENVQCESLSLCNMIT